MTDRDPVPDPSKPGPLRGVRWAHEELKHNAAARSGEPESALSDDDEADREGD
jgi:hypothetical protein